MESALESFYKMSNNPNATITQIIDAFTLALGEVTANPESLSEYDSLRKSFVSLMLKRINEIKLYLNNLKQLEELLKALIMFSYIYHNIQLSTTLKFDNSKNLSGFVNSINYRCSLLTVQSTFLDVSDIVQDILNLKYLLNQE